jgi:tetratricopeptide (TPR) repeat protein
MKTCAKMTTTYLLFTVVCLLLPLPISAQQTEPSLTPQSLRLPEVVITGIDRAQIQSVIAKVEPRLPLPIVTQSSLDLSEALIREGDKLSLNRLSQAEERYAQALALDPTNTTAYLRLGDVYRALNKPPEAVDIYSKTLAVSADNLEAHYKLGMLYESQLQDRQQAIEQYRAYIQLGGADTRVKIWLRDLERP